MSFSRILVLTLMPTAACLSVSANGESDDDDDGDESAAASSSDDGSAHAEVAFYEDVAPLLAAHCNGCHREGGVAPFTLTSYADAVAWAAPILTAIEARTMPPFTVNNDGSCQTFTDARWLADEEIDTIARWVAAATPEGDASLGMPEPPETPKLSGPGVRNMVTPELYVPKAGLLPDAALDDYRCFLVDPELASDQYLVGFEIVPGDARMVHHVLVFNVDPARSGGATTNADAMTALDDASPDEPGWPCFGSAGEGVWVEGVPITWAPGTGATRFPGGAGVRLDAGQQLVVQVHYNLAQVEAGSTAPATGIALELADDVERRAHVALVDGFLLSLFKEPAMLPPGDPAAAFSYEVTLAQIPNMTTEFENVDVIGVLPHMHTRGTRMKIDFDIDGKTECGADVDRWDFDWQQTFFFEDPIAMKMTDTMRVGCEWNTEGETEPVGPSLGTEGEMCLVGVMVAER
jgi:mono/diheme cytochrome c family protein